MASILRLHLQYRLWIAAMNSDIDVLRICDDYFVMLEEKHLDTETKNQIKKWKEQFGDLRKDVDELRHEMHLVKMKLGALAKEQASTDEDIEELINHKSCKERYKAYRKKFSKIKKEFKKFEPE